MRGSHHRFMSLFPLCISPLCYFMGKKTKNKKNDNTILQHVYSCRFCFTKPDEFCHCELYSMSSHLPLGIVEAERLNNLSFCLEQLKGASSFPSRNACMHLPPLILRFRVGVSSLCIQKYITELTWSSYLRIMVEKYKNKKKNNLAGTTIVGNLK